MLLPSCAPALGGARGNTAADVPRLERRLEQDRQDTRVLTALGAAYRDAGRQQDAVRMLSRAVELDPASAPANFYLGILAEETGNVAEARQWYARYLHYGGSRRTTNQVRSRLLALERAELLADIRAAVAQEAQLSATPDAAAVAVYPFLYVGSDSTLRPLERAMAEMLSVDLAVSPQLRVLERSRVQLLLDEIQLAESGRVDPATAAKSGRLLRAGTIIQARLDGTEAELGLQAAVLGLQEPGREPATLVERDAVRRLFDMQKRLAVGVFRSLGVTLSAEEQARLDIHQTQNLQALLLFGLGLEAFDAGRFADAAQLFGDASALDPSFRAAGDYSARAASAAEGSQVTPGQLAQSAAADMAGVAGPDNPLDAIQVLLPEDVVRSPAPDALGTEGIGRRTIIDIIIRRPQE